MVAMVDQNEKIIQNEIKAYKAKVKRHTRIVSLLILVLMVLLGVFGGDFLYAFAFSTSPVLNASLKETMNQATSEEMLADVSDGFSLDVYQSFRREEINETGDEKDVESAVDMIEEESDEILLYDLSFNSSLNQNAVVPLAGIELMELDAESEMTMQALGSGRSLDATDLQTEKVFNETVMNVGVEGEAMTFYEKAGLYYYLENYSSALDFYALALANDDAGVVPFEARFGRLFVEDALIRLQGNDLEGALDALGQAILVAPALSDAYYWQAVVLFQLGNVEKAIGSLRECLLRDDEFGKAYSFLGYLYYVRGDYAQANALLDEAIELMPEDASAYLYLGFVYEKMKMPEGALLSYQRALVLMDDVAEINYVNELVRSLE